jgi:putative chitinase
MDRTVFFDRVRAKPFGGSLSQDQVDGLNAILDAADKHGVTDVRHLAYALATAYWETARTMQPIAEYGRGKGRKYGVKSKYGQVPYGRGYVQLTWDENYERADKELGLGGNLLKNFDLALDPGIAAAIMFRGMTEGWFTGRRLVHYFSAQLDDPVNARKIINGTDKAATIAGLHADFLAALRAAKWGAPTVTVSEPPAGRDYYTPADVKAPSAPAKTGWAALIAFIVAIFKRSAK